jgi:uncharacterized protein involved in exopolysaccharide biosynthesis
MEAQVRQNEITRIEEDEIDLRELARTIGRHKKKLIAFTVAVTLVSVLWSLSKPNIYASSAILVPQEQSKSSSLGGLGALAGIAGVDLGGGEMSADQGYQLFLNDYVWVRKFLIETKLIETMNAPKRDENYRFARDIRAIYELGRNDEHTPIETMDEAQREKLLFDTYQRLKSGLVISKDKQTSTITLSYSDPDAVLAKEIVEKFLVYASASLRQSDLADMEKKIAYYNQELSKTNDLSLKTQLSQLMSALIQKKVLAQSSEYYNVKLITSPSVAYAEDKVGPKRGLIVMVSFVTSLIVGIFGIFFLEFLRNKPEETLP